MAATSGVSKILLTCDSSVRYQVNWLNVPIGGSVLLAITVDRSGNLLFLFITVTEEEEDMEILCCRQSQNVCGM